MAPDELRNLGTYLLRDWADDESEMGRGLNPVTGFAESEDDKTPRDDSADDASAETTRTTTTANVAMMTKTASEGGKPR